MTNDAVLGVDLGTSVVKAGVYSMDGRQLATSSRPLKLVHGPGGQVTQDLDEFYASASEASRECVGGLPVKIKAAAFSGQMAGVGLVDSHHRALAAYDSWLDTRCGPEAAELGSALGERITRTSGCAPTISIGPKLLWWHRHHSSVLAGAASFVTAAGYVAGRAVGLSGSEAFIDPSYLHFASFADVGAGAWDDELVEIAGLRPELLPRVVESTAIVGSFTASAAADFGLDSRVPVAAGCGDTAASALGAGVSEAGQAFDVAGTAGVFGVCVPAFVPDQDSRTLMTMRSAFPGLWYELAYVGGAGQLIEWVCRQILGHDRLDAVAYADLGAAVSRVPVGCDGVIMFPHMMGRVAPAAPWVRGTYAGLSPTTTREHLARAALEAIAYEYLGYADLVRAQIGPNAITEVIGAGGGSRLAAWNQIKADALQTTYRPVVGIDPGTRGAALVAMAAIGKPCPPLHPSDIGASAVPDASAGAAFRRGYMTYRRWADAFVSAYGQISQVDSLKEEAD